MPRKAAVKLNFRPRSSLDSRLLGGSRDGPGRTEPLDRRDGWSTGGAAAGGGLFAASFSSKLMTMVVALPFRFDRPTRTCVKSDREAVGELTALLAAEARPLRRPSRRPILDRRDPVGPLLPLLRVDGWLGSSVELRACVDGGREGTGVEVPDIAWTASEVGW